MENQNPNWFAKHKIITVISVIIILGLIGSLSTKNSTPTNNNNVVDNNSNTNNNEIVLEEAIKITAKELMTKYEANELEADNLYKGKLLEVSGNVDGVGKDIFDSPYITLKTNEMFSNIKCMIKDSEVSKASKLKEDDSIILEGKCDGILMDVTLKDCIIK
ncbi:hypothetical protein EOM09_05175 [bacterium]|nr:hypothetical protein [bacterium]